jgi:hypothetical protein
VKLGFVFDPRDIGIDERDDPQPRLQRLAQALLQEEPVSRELANWFADLVAAGRMQVTMPDGRGKSGEGNTVPKALRLAAVSMARERMLQVKQEREQEETLNQKQPLSKRKQAPRQRKLKPDAITKDVIVEVLAELKLTSCTCRRRSNIDPPCRSNTDPGMDAGRARANCG